MKTKTKNLKLTLEYDGARYFGFQRQPGKKTIQSELESALKKFFKKEIKLAAASGRTDAGVHAEGQVVNFHVETSQETFQILRGLNHFLPDDIAVRQIRVMPQEFHSRYSVRSKVYTYEIWNSAVHSPLFDSRTVQVPQKLCLNSMRNAAKKFLGKHDFSSLTSQKARHRGREKGSPELSAVRTITQLTIRKQGPKITVTVEADGFLYHMVRNLVGTLVEVGRGQISAQDVSRILKSNDRKLAGPTLPANALTLKSVFYK